MLFVLSFSLSLAHKARILSSFPLKTAHMARHFLITHFKIIKCWICCLPAAKTESDVLGKLEKTEILGPIDKIRRGRRLNAELKITQALSDAPAHSAITPSPVQSVEGSVCLNRAPGQILQQPLNASLLLGGGTDRRRERAPLNSERSLVHMCKMKEHAQTHWTCVWATYGINYYQSSMQISRPMYLK